MDCHSPLFVGVGLRLAVAAEKHHLLFDCFFNILNLEVSHVEIIHALWDLRILIISRTLSRKNGASARQNTDIDITVKTRPYKQIE